MARPKKKVAEQRRASTRCDLTLAEKEELAQMVSASGLPSEAEFVRRAIFGAKIVTPALSSSADPALIVALNRVGNNVNQLARSVHRGSDFQRYWHEVGDDLRRVLVKSLEGFS